MDWEKYGAPINEGTQAFYNDQSGVFVTYSAGSCGSQYYSLGWLTWNGGDPVSEGSWEKSEALSLSSANGNFGTGIMGKQAYLPLLSSV